MNKRMSLSDLVILNCNSSVVQKMLGILLKGTEAIHSRGSGCGSAGCTDKTAGQTKIIIKRAIPQSGAS